MIRILVNECKQEVSSFNPVLSHYDDFAVHFGRDIVAANKDVQSEMAGALTVFANRSDVVVVPGFSARGITSAGIMAAADFKRMAGEFLDAVRNAGDIDAIYYSLHGALASETELDPEGYFLAETRKIVGEKMPIVISMDLHGIVTDRILEHVDALTLYHTYPHVDFYQTGERAARLLLRIIDGEVRPVSVRVRIPALVRGYELITETGMFGACVRNAIAFENGPSGLSGGMFIGNPFTDVPELCSNVYLCSDNQPEQAERAALAIAEQFWNMREHLQQPLTSLGESVQVALAAEGRVVLVDAADATSSGASGDSNAVLRALVEVGYRKTALIPIVDRPAVVQAFKAGVGATIRTRIGGSLDPRFVPLEMELRVRMLSDGYFRNESHGSYWDAGETAVLQSGNYTLVVTSRPVSLYDRSLFLSHGQDPAVFAATVVKSPHCQPRFFAEGAEALINVDAPGSTSADIKSLGHKICSRPIFPLDERVTFTPKAQFFSRVTNHAARQ
jgi:microcystin degradation protein MlrC